MAGEFSGNASPSVEMIQTVLLFGGFLLNSIASYREANFNGAQTLLALSEQHDEIWTQLLNSKELERVLQEEADPKARALTRKEEESVNLLLVHYLKSWRLATRGCFLTLDELATDVKNFVRLPIPAAVWEMTKDKRNPKFVRFVENALKKN